MTKLNQFCAAMYMDRDVFQKSCWHSRDSASLNLKHWPNESWQHLELIQTKKKVVFTGKLKVAGDRRLLGIVHFLTATRGTLNMKVYRFVSWFCSTHAIQFNRPTQSSRKFCGGTTGCRSTSNIRSKWNFQGEFSNSQLGSLRIISKCQQKYNSRIIAGLNENLAWNRSRKIPDDRYIRFSCFLKFLKENFDF